MGKMDIEGKSLAFLGRLLEVYMDEEIRTKLGYPEDDGSQDIESALIALEVFVQGLTEFDGNMVAFLRYLQPIAEQIDERKREEKRKLFWPGEEF